MPPGAALFNSLGSTKVHLVWECAPGILASAVVTLLKQRSSTPSFGAEDIPE